MTLNSPTIANVTMIAAPTLMFLAASTVLLLVTGPSKAQAPQPQRVEIRGGETVEVTGPNGRAMKLRFSKVVADGQCASPRGCTRTGAPVVEIEAVGSQAPTFRLSPAAHLGAPFVPVQGRFVAFGELVSPPRELTTANRAMPLDSYVLRLTVTP
ncbi:hypothetical protein [Phreatobacter cathodiphilus]|uniref:Uncharacterized protein n=1 Tax=Phreatobacter cathodiphilus TaxID=1868589 RepID=A0A2S0N905_9HYPH|nr:hypothetical protein [Phreatobacter cathodiphilus]AVO44497.1 hypothetical protein C6569_05140 [Phreatobacter cathodiphilus]